MIITSGADIEERENTISDINLRGVIEEVTILN
jgi:hypothetical protein